MLKIKNVNVLHNDFLPAFEKLMYRQMPAKQCLELSMSLEELTSHQAVARKARVAILTKHGKKNPDGTVMADTNGNAIFPDLAAQNACMAELAEIDQDTIEIPLTDKITVYEDEDFIPVQMYMLRSVIDVKPRPKAAEVVAA